MTFVTEALDSLEQGQDVYIELTRVRAGCSWVEAWVALEVDVESHAAGDAVTEAGAQSWIVAGESGVAGVRAGLR